MARQRKLIPDEIFAMTKKHRDGTSHDVYLIGRGRWLILGVERLDALRQYPDQVALFTGRKTLRALAFAILDATGGRTE